MEILIDNEKCKTVNTLKTLATFLPIRAKTLCFADLHKYISEELSHNKRLSFTRVDEGVWGIQLDGESVIMVFEKES